MVVYFLIYEAMEYISLILNVLTFILICMAGWLITKYFPSYFSEKGKNLATKEDIEEITRIVEDVKSKVSVNIELIKWELSKKATVHRLAAEKEFQALTEIGEALYELQIATMNLRPAMDIVDPDEPAEKRYARRYGEWAQRHDDFMNALGRHRLFLPKYLYQRFIEIKRLATHEAIGFKASLACGGGTLKFGAYQESEKNISELLDAIVKALDAISQRYGIEG